MQAHGDTQSEVFESLRAKLVKLRDDLTGAEARSTNALASVHSAYRASAVNLVHYLVTRQIDLRPVQLDLWRLGLSSLGRIEGHVRDALEQVIARLDDVLARLGVHRVEASTPIGVLLADDGDRLLRLHSEALFGPKPPGRHVYVMVTAPDAADVTEAWVARLLAAGMNVLRVNGAHEDVPEWQHIVQTARRVATAQKAALRVLVDLPGPKLRTVAPCAGPRVTRWKPERDAFGRVTSHCQVVLRPSQANAGSFDEPNLQLPAEVWAQLAIGDELVLRDARDRKRRLKVVDCTQERAIATLDRTAYVIPETVVDVVRAGGASRGFRCAMSPLDRSDSLCPKATNSDSEEALQRSARRPHPCLRWAAA
jgi:pyruvate kinase